MNPELKAQWLTALRSGEFKQTEGFLKDDLGYCWLGVLYEVAGLPWRELSVLPDGYLFPSNQASVNFAHRIDAPYSELMELANMNDRGCSFAEIADRVEKNL